MKRVYIGAYLEVELKPIIKIVEDIKCPNCGIQIKNAFVKTAKYITTADINYNRLYSVYFLKRPDSQLIFIPEALDNRIGTDINGDVEGMFDFEEKKEAIETFESEFDSIIYSIQKHESVESAVVKYGIISHILIV